MAVNGCLAKTPVKQSSVRKRKLTDKAAFFILSAKVARERKGKRQICRGILLASPLLQSNSALRTTHPHCCFIVLRAPLRSRFYQASTIFTYGGCTYFDLKQHVSCPEVGGTFRR
jgi:hypothetical protein